MFCIFCYNGIISYAAHILKRLHAHFLHSLPLSPACPNIPGWLPPPSSDLPRSTLRGAVSKRVRVHWRCEIDNSVYVSSSDRSPSPIPSTLPYETQSQKSTTFSAVVTFILFLPTPAKIHIILFHFLLLKKRVSRLFCRRPCDGIESVRWHTYGTILILLHFFCRMPHHVLHFYLW